VRIGRYLNQSVITREHQVGNVTNRESSGVGVRVIVNGAWGFAATHQQTEAAVRAAVEQAAAIARANASIQTRPVQLAPTPSVGRCAGRPRPQERDGGADPGQGRTAAGASMPPR
jgi:TldD protein